MRSTVASSRFDFFYHQVGVEHSVPLHGRRDTTVRKLLDQGRPGRDALADGILGHGR